MSTPRTTLVLSAALLISACGTRGSLYKDAIKPLPILSTNSSLVQVVPQTQRAVVITPGDSTPAGIEISKNARIAANPPGSNLVLILAGTAKAPVLDLVDVTTGERLTLDAPGFFDAIHFSPDSRFAVLTYVAGAGTGTLAARNLNEVGLVDLEAKTVVRLQLDTESLAPRSVLFGPVEANRRLVAVALERGVAVFDALHPEVAPRRISLRPSGSTIETSVAKAVFSDDGHWLFVRATGIDDVVVIELGPEVGAPVSASVNFVSGGRGLTDIAAPPGGLKDSVLAVFAASEEAFILDARGIADNAKRIGLPDALSKAAVLQGTRVLFYDERLRTVAAWDVNDGRSGAAALDGTFASPLVVPDLEKAIFPHSAVDSSAGSGPALSVVTVEDATNRLRAKIQSIQLARPVNTWTTDATGQRLFFAGSPGDAVVTMDLQSLQLAEVSLDAPPATLHFLPEGDWVAAEHSGNPLGDVTFVPAGSTERSAAIRYSDFAYTDDLDRAEDAR